LGLKTYCWRGEREEREVVRKKVRKNCCNYLLCIIYKLLEGSWGDGKEVVRKKDKKKVQKKVLKKFKKKFKKRSNKSSTKRFRNDNFWRGLEIGRIVQLYLPRAHGALIFVALIVKIESCNNKKNHGLPSKLFYFRR
jgi:hypothetical protein